MAVDELGSAVDDSISAKRQGPLQNWGSEGIVHDDSGPMRMGDIGGRLDVDDSHCRVGRRLNVNHFGIGLG